MDKDLAKVLQHEELYNAGHFSGDYALELGNYGNLRDDLTRLSFYAPSAGSSWGDGYTIEFAFYERGLLVEKYSRLSTGLENLAAYLDALGALVNANPESKFTYTNTGVGFFDIHPDVPKHFSLVYRLNNGNTNDIVSNGSGYAGSYTLGKDVYHTYTHLADPPNDETLFGYSARLPDEENDYEVVFYDAATCMIQDVAILNSTENGLVVNESSILGEFGLDASFHGKLFEWDSGVFMEYDEEKNCTFFRFPAGHGMPNILGAMEAFSIARRNFQKGMDNMRAPLWYVDEHTLVSPDNNSSSRQDSLDTHLVLCPVVLVGAAGKQLLGDYLTVSFTYDPETSTFTRW